MVVLFPTREWYSMDVGQAPLDTALLSKIGLITELQKLSPFIIHSQTAGTLKKTNEAAMGSPFKTHFFPKDAAGRGEAWPFEGKTGRI